MLGLHAREIVSTSMLVDLLWGTDPPRTAVRSAQTRSSSLRRALGDGVISTRGPGWILTTEVVVDAVEFRRAAAAARDAVLAGELDRAAIAFDAAQALWRGPPELPTT